jgi:hypothetical protein
MRHQATYKTLSAFPNRDAYVDYIKATLQIGMRVVAVTGERKGDRGAYLGTNGGRPPCNVQWEDFGRSYWVEWHDVEIVGAVQSAGQVPAATGAKVRAIFPSRTYREIRAIRFLKTDAFVTRPDVTIFCTIPRVQTQRFAGTQRILDAPTLLPQISVSSEGQCFNFQQ